MALNSGNTDFGELASLLQAESERAAYVRALLRRSGDGRTDSDLLRLALYGLAEPTALGAEGRVSNCADRPASCGLPMRRTGSCCTSA